jgi:hypothetical protein
MKPSVSRIANTKHALVKYGLLLIRPARIDDEVDVLMLREMERMRWLHHCPQFTETIEEAIDFVCVELDFEGRGRLKGDGDGVNVAAA